MARRKNKPPGIITLLTDFGLSDTYISQIKGSILNINPDAKIIDITHEVKMGDILSASFLLWTSFKYFPRGTVHLAVVDPGVGTERSGIIIETGRYFFVGPDNGIFTIPLKEEEIIRIIKINYKLFGRISNTFHGRDVFGPVSAKLSKGIPSQKFGNEVTLDQLEFLKIPEPIIKKNKIIGTIIHIDNFGNLITNIPGSLLESKNFIVRVKGRKISGFCRAYGFASEGQLIALINSSGLLEIAINSGSAVKFLRCKTGDRVVVIN